MTNKRILQNVKVDSVSLVAAPKCEGCGDAMKGADSTNWHCINTKCDRQLQRVEIGNCYPFHYYEEEANG